MGGEVSHRSLRLEVSAALGQSEHVVDRLLSLAFSATHLFPGSLAALKSGRVSGEHVRVIADAGQVLGQGESSTERDIDAPGMSVRYCGPRGGNAESVAAHRTADRCGVV